MYSTAIFTHRTGSVITIFRFGFFTSLPYYIYLNSQQNTQPHTPFYYHYYYASLSFVLYCLLFLLFGPRHNTHTRTARTHARLSPFCTLISYIITIELCAFVFFNCRFVSLWLVIFTITVYVYVVLVGWCLCVCVRTLCSLSLIVTNCFRNTLATCIYWTPYIFFSKFSIVLLLTPLCYCYYCSVLGTGHLCSLFICSQVTICPRCTFVDNCSV